jgi:acylphosphatase
MAKLVHYSGDVQGVGFRATASWVAKRHPVRGWVRNLPDGRVELLVDGADDAIAAFLAEVRSRMADNIESVEEFDRDPDTKLTGFHTVP